MTLKVVHPSDDLSSSYVAIDQLAVATLSVMYIVAYVSWCLQHKVDVILALIYECERHIVELINENDMLAKKNSSQENYIEDLKEILRACTAGTSSILSDATGLRNYRRTAKISNLERRYCLLHILLWLRHIMSQDTDSLMHGV